jgi:hypothetical protein
MGSKVDSRRFATLPRQVEALIELGIRARWTRWPPGRHLSGPQYVNQWTDDLRECCAGGRTLDEVANPRFFDWLLRRGYPRDGEKGSLEEWVNSKPSGTEVHIRPGIEVRRTWPSADEFAPDRKGEFVAEVREAVDRVLSALDEPRLRC